MPRLSARPRDGEIFLLIRVRAEAAFAPRHLCAWGAGGVSAAGVGGYSGGASGVGASRAPWPCLAGVWLSNRVHVRRAGRASIGLQRRAWGVAYCIRIAVSVRGRRVPWRQGGFSNVPECARGAWQRGARGGGMPCARLCQPCAHDAAYCSCHTCMARFCCSQVSLVGGLVLRMSVLAGNKARTGMVGLRTHESGVKE